MNPIQEVYSIDPGDTSVDRVGRSALMNMMILPAEEDLSECNVKDKNIELLWKSHGL